jgi:hypothetical protein
MRAAATALATDKKMGGGEWGRAQAPADGGSWWHHVVEDFTSRSITLPSDRLPALSGLAAAFGRRGGGRYLAGIWCDMLFTSLQWRVVRGGESARHETYYAPSFSWASVTGRVEFQAPLGSFRSVFHVPTLMEAKTVPVGSNKFGPVASASILVRTLVADVTLVEEEPPAEEDGSSRQAAFGVVPRDNGAQIKGVAGVVHPDVLPAVEIAGQSSKFRLLFVGVRTGVDRHEPLALLVKPAGGGHRKNCFVRVGLVECSTWLFGWELFARTELVTIV